MDPSQSSHLRGELRLLSHFATEWRRLQAGGALLPDLLEFYLWIHTSLGGLVKGQSAAAAAAASIGLEMLSIVLCND